MSPYPFPFPVYRTFDADSSGSTSYREFERLVSLTTNAMSRPFICIRDMVPYHFRFLPTGRLTSTLPDRSTTANSRGSSQRLLPPTAASAPPIPPPVSAPPLPPTVSTRSFHPTPLPPPVSAPLLPPVSTRSFHPARAHSLPPAGPPPRRLHTKTRLHSNMTAGAPHTPLHTRLHTKTRRHSDTKTRLHRDTKTRLHSDTPLQTPIHSSLHTPPPSVAPSCFGWSRSSHQRSTRRWLNSRRSAIYYASLREMWPR